MPSRSHSDGMRLKVRLYTTNANDSEAEIRVNREDEVIARANNLLVGRAAFETAVRLYPRDLIQYQDGARIIARRDRESG